MLNSQTVNDQDQWSDINVASKPQILDGKAISAQIQDFLQTKVEHLISFGARSPVLSVVLVGDNPASQTYVKMKKKACEEIGITYKQINLPSAATTDQIIETIKALNYNNKVDGILVQLPLPLHTDTNEIISSIAPEKDVDGIHPLNLGKLAHGKPDFIPCTPFGVMELLEHTKVDLKGKNALVVGKSTIVGKPMRDLLDMQGATVISCDINEKDLQAKVRAAEIIIVATGSAQCVKSDWIPQDAIVIDVGIHKNVSTGLISGDVEDCRNSQAGFVAPVPGGVGPMTVAMLMHNTIDAYVKRMVSKLKEENNPENAFELAVDPQFDYGLYPAYDFNSMKKIPELAQIYEHDQALSQKVDQLLENIETDIAETKKIQYSAKKARYTE